MRDRNTSVRRIAAIALGKIGPAAKEAVPALRRALNDDDLVVQMDAAEALEQIEGR